MENRFYFLFFIFWIHCIGVLEDINAQELPPVTTYTTEQYGADNQNWAIAQSDDLHLYVANNKGLLHHNGEAWTLYQSPNESILRSVHVYKDKVYSGCYRDFGYWTKTAVGDHTYHSLVEEFGLELEEDEQFWKILDFEGVIIFQSLDNIFIYDPETKKINKIKGIEEVHKVFIAQNQIYFSDPHAGIFQIINGEAQLVNSAPIFKENLVINMYQIEEEVIVQTDKSGIYTFTEDPQPWGGELVDFLQSISVYNSIQSAKGFIVLGTIANGVVFINKDGSIEYQINKTKGLTNNTVLSLFEDKNENIWLGLDNGINCINQSSPFRSYYDETGSFGTVYTSALFQDHLFLGTNQGLYYKPLMDAMANFEMIPNSNGQVWNLYVYDNKLFCGHNNGAFIVEDFTLKPLQTSSGVWNFVSIPSSADVLLAGSYDGLSLFYKNENTWQLKNTLEGFKLSSKFVEFTSPRIVLVAHEYKGVYRLHLNDTLTKVEKIEHQDEIEKGLYSSLAKIGDKIYYAYEKGMYKYDEELQVFEIDSVLTQLSYQTDNYSSGKLIPVPNANSFWSFTHRGINFITPSKLSEKYEVIFIPIPSEVRNAMVGYENITKLNDQQYLFGNSQGYIVIDIQQIKKQPPPLNIQLNTVVSKTKENLSKKLNLEGNQLIDYAYNNLYFSFSTPTYHEFYEVEYQYRLVGFSSNWSPWTNDSNAVFSNLPFGDYKLEVRSRLGTQVSENTLAYSFSVNRPYFLSNVMLVLYAFLFLLLIVVTHNFYKQYYKVQKRKLQEQSERELELKELEAQQKIMHIHNDKLKQDIENKNRELAISTMSLVKKNEFLAKIKNDLLQVKAKDNKLDSVLKTINKNINNSDDWKFFEEAFNNADKDFLKKIKSKHPSLTPNDLKLCAYLRLNLSSKEIAPLFNISPRSVEVKRYRLRKKMDLPHDEGLTNYILDI